MSSKNGVITTGLVVLAVVCSLSLILFIYFTDVLDIEKISLKSGVFRLINNNYEFELEDLQDITYNVVLEFLPGNADEFHKIMEKWSTRNKYIIYVELYDEKGKIINSDKLDERKKMSGSYSVKSVSWDLLRFNLERQRKYLLRIKFQSNDIFFDKLAKEIYVEEDFDYASGPWCGVLQAVFFVLFIATLLPILLITLIYWLKRRKKGRKELNLDNCH